MWQAAQTIRPSSWPPLKRKNQKAKTNENKLVKQIYIQLHGTTAVLNSVNTYHLPNIFSVFFNSLKLIRPNFNFFQADHSITDKIFPHLVHFCPARGTHSNGVVVEHKLSHFQGPACIFIYYHRLCWFVC